MKNYIVEATNVCAALELLGQYGKGDATVLQAPEGIFSFAFESKERIGNTVREHYASKGVSILKRKESEVTV